MSGRNKGGAPGVTELHLHLEGSLPSALAITLASRLDHAWGRLSVPELNREFRFRTFDAFLEVIKKMCRVLSSTVALQTASKSLSLFLEDHGVLYAEIYFSPHIFGRWGLSFDDSSNAVCKGFDEGESEGGADCRILYDTVRQWGPEPAESILRDHERTSLKRAVGFGIGGDETEPLERFVDVFSRARDLGLRTTAHAGELGPPGDVATAIDRLKVDRVAHGIRALEDPGLIREIVSRRIPLDLALTSNYRTGAVRGLHPVRQLLDAGVIVTLNTDDPGIFRTSPTSEFKRAARWAGIKPTELDRIAENAISASFADDSTRAGLLEALSNRRNERKV